MSLAADRPLRIVHVPPRYAPYVGGVEAHCQGYVRESRRRGHQVTVLCADDGPPAASVEGVPVRRCATAGKLANTNLTPSLPLHLLATQADIIHTYLPTPWSADWATLLGRLRGTPVVLTYANDIVGQGLADAAARAYNAVALPLTLRAASRILVSSTSYRDDSPRLAPFRAKTMVLPPGVDTDRYAPGDHPRWPATFFFLSVLDEFHRYKGLDVLLRALAELRRTGPCARLIVGGRGALLAEYRALAGNLGITDAVEFRGYVPAQDLIGIYQRCTAFVLPSISAAQEGFGMVAVEALACGAPVIVSDIVGVAGDVAARNAGWVIPAGDSGQLAAALGAALRSGAQRAGSPGRALAMERYGWRTLGDQLEGVYAELAARRTGGRP